MSLAERILPELSLNDRLLADARDLEIDVSKAAANGIAQAIKAERERLWRIENADAIEASNRYVEKHGLPFAKYRTF